jgi:hypothetical protein
MKICEAKYGDKKCENKAERTILFFNTSYNLCRDCAKLHNKQMKLNNR